MIWQRFIFWRRTQTSSRQPKQKRQTTVSFPLKFATWTRSRTRWTSLPWPLCPWTTSARAETIEDWPEPIMDATNSSSRSSLDLCLCQPELRLELGQGQEDQCLPEVLESYPGYPHPRLCQGAPIPSCRHCQWYHRHQPRLKRGLLSCREKVAECDCSWTPPPASLNIIWWHTVVFNVIGSELLPAKSVLIHTFQS